MKKIYSILVAVFLLCQINSSYAQFTKLMDFEGVTSGANPEGTLFFDGTYLYGMAKNGGANYKGVIYKIKPDGTGYEKIYDFLGSVNGGNPTATLISDGTYLYGLTSYGGTSNFGVVFKIKPDGTNYEKILDFNGDANGQYPLASLFFYENYLYGTTYSGGANGMGVMFKIKPDGTGHEIMLHFDGVTNGSYPRREFITDGTYLYGITNSGGIYDYGTIFKIKPDGTDFQKILDFKAGETGRYPIASLTLDGDYLYCSTTSSSTTDFGSIVKLKKDGTEVQNILNYQTQHRPYSSLVRYGDYFYSMTNEAGANNLGTIYRIKPDGSNFEILFDFDGTTNGRNPDRNLVLVGKNLFGMTPYGGTNNYGIVFKYDLCPSTTFTQTFEENAGFSVSVGSHTYSETGIYIDTLTNSIGCDSIVTTNLTINLIPKYDILGTIKYDNVSETAMNNVKVYLKQNDIAVDSTIPMQTEIICLRKKKLETIQFRLQPINFGTELQKKTQH